MVENLLFDRMKATIRDWVMILQHASDQLMREA